MHLTSDHRGNFLNSGGSYSRAIGISFVYYSGRLTVKVRTEETFWLSTEEPSIKGPGNWTWITLTWFPLTGVDVYADGCLLYHVNAEARYRDFDPSFSPSFTLGGTTYPFNGALDEVLMWDVGVSGDTIWQMYRQGPRP